MKTKTILLTCVLCTGVFVGLAEDYKAFSENFGNQTTLISKTCENSPADTVTATSISSGTFVVLNARGSGNGSVLLDENASVWPTDANTYAGVVKSTVVFNAASPVTSFDGNGSGFAAYTSKNNQNNGGNPWTWMRVFIDGERLVVGEQYSLSFRYANGANANWIPDEGITATTGGTNVQVRGLIYPNVNNINASPTWQNIASNGSSNSLAGHDSGYTDESSWLLYSITAGSNNVAVAGSNMVCDIRGWLNTGSVLLIDSINLVGPRPVLLVQQGAEVIQELKIQGTSTNPGLSDAIMVGCNAAGTKGIKAVISGDDADLFTLVDESGNPIPENIIELPGGNVFVKYSPEAGTTTNKNAILTFSASSEPNYGAIPVVVALTGESDVNGIFRPQLQRVLTIKNNPVINELSVTAPFTGEVEWAIYNSAGNRIFNAVGTSQLTTETSLFQAGIYLVSALNKATGENGIIRFIKQ
jgi:hypothetical protein